MDYTTTTWLSFIIILLAIQAGAILFGYWLARNVDGKPLSEQPKRFDPGPPGVEVDPYEEALRPDTGKRIPTV